MEDTTYYFQKKTINGHTVQYVPKWNQQLETFQLIETVLD